MISGILDACDFVSRTNAELAQFGVPRDEVTYERQRRTGHVRRISPVWAPSIGMWGGVRSLREIADALDVPVPQAHSWAQFRRLRTRTRTFHRTQAQLAIAALATPGAAREVARELGVLPIECVLYRSAAEVMRVELGVGLREMLEWSPGTLEDAWRDLGLVVEHAPSCTTINLEDPEELEQIVNAASRVGSTDVEKLLALINRELPIVETTDDPSPERRSHDATQRVVGSLPAALADDLAAMVEQAERAAAAEPPTTEAGDPC